MALAVCNGARAVAVWEGKAPQTRGRRLEDSAVKVGDLLLTEEMLQVKDALSHTHESNQVRPPSPPNSMLRPGGARRGGAFLPPKYCKCFAHARRLNIEFGGEGGHHGARRFFVCMCAAGLPEP